MGRYCTLTRFGPLLTRLWHTLALQFCLMGRKIDLSLKTNVLPIYARYKQQPLIRRGQRGVRGVQKHVRIRYFFISLARYIYLENKISTLPFETSD